MEYATVAELLAASWAAHTRYRQAARKPIDEVAKIAALTEASDLRQRAHDADPEHDDPAWASEDAKTHPIVRTHDAMMAFYQKALS